VSATSLPGGAAARPSALRIWLLAARPATLPAALSGVVVGLGVALGLGHPLRPDTALGCLAVALLLQIVANFANDLSDFRKGADTPDRAGPIRVAAAGLVTERQLEIAIAVTLLAAGVVGLWLATVGGPFLVGLGALAMVAALAYTGGPWPYGYKALGEVFVFTFFGLVAVVGTAYLQALSLHPLFVVAAVPVGAMVTAILVVNNLRDISTDAAAGKRTLAVVIGRGPTQAEYTLLLSLAYLIPAGLGILVLAAGNPYGLALFLPLVTLPFGARILSTVWRFKVPRELNLALKGTAQLTFLHAALFAAGLFTALKAAN
jgi:1,4-dihydroxy-2-naphthoate octaprenyltransferase